VGALVVIVIVALGGLGALGHFWDLEFPTYSVFSSPASPVSLKALWTWILAKLWSRNPSHSLNNSHVNASPNYQTYPNNNYPVGTPVGESEILEEDEEVRLWFAERQLRRDRILNTPLKAWGKDQDATNLGNALSSSSSTPINLRESLDLVLVDTRESTRLSLSGSAPGNSESSPLSPLTGSPLSPLQSSLGGYEEETESSSSAPHTLFPSKANRDGKGVIERSSKLSGEESKENLYQLLTYRDPSKYSRQEIQDLGKYLTLREVESGYLHNYFVSEGERAEWEQGGSEEKSKDINSYDWNQRFQMCIEAIKKFDASTSINERISWNMKLLHLAQDFLYTAQLYGKVIISEAYSSEKTIKPVGNLEG